MVEWWGKMLKLRSRVSPRLARRFSTAVVEYASSCHIPTTWLPLPLLSREAVNHDTSLYKFGLPAGQALNLPACACILLRAPGQATGGEDAVRPYTPISADSTLGSFTLIVKRYDGGAASQWLHSLDVGKAVDFKHIKFNLKAQYPFEGKSTISLVCAGTGIAPMYQALGKLLGTPGDDRKIVLLYGQ